MTYLILRFSTIGNVAMVVPVLTSLSKQYPDDRFIMVARHRLADLFYGLDNVVFHEADLSHGWRSLSRLLNQLRSYEIDAVLDLQDTLRSHVIRTVLRGRGAKVYTIQYGRKEKRMLTLRGYRHAASLPTQFERYEATFREAGLSSSIPFESISVNASDRQYIEDRYGVKQGRWIGIAPFASNESNILPGRVMKEVIAYYSKQCDCRICLFGAGRIEAAMLQQWAAVFPNVVSIAGQLTLSQELELMRMLDVMVCMDSANQHLAALVGVRTISVWCATHPAMGFAGWGQQTKDQLQLPIGCRPCTIHGRKDCKYRNFACKGIDAQMIIHSIENQ